GLANSVPESLAEAIKSEGFSAQRVALDLGDGGQLYFVVGRQLAPKWGTIDIYYFFPLGNEIALANEFGNIILATGVALVIMLVIVAFLVTRMVVSPVRVAARTAQRLSNGLLDQRMVVN